MIDSKRQVMWMFRLLQRPRKARGFVSTMPVHQSRQHIGFCDGCRCAAEPLVYFQNGGNYCVSCARQLHGRMGWRSAGKRAGDVQIP